ncbi:hypothetical protein Clacol_010278 [Clathrus columnatus]|uniref:Major facilitator superfamily (MFS) profile domain-containing protein n=1 Tax=Clathrus columnatus TaxID=1419009 RepID=A0AAV5ATB3_9AGAM|nr:hypothetical protein Clacol_010278 [Clathrus columnatus]
MSGEPDRRLDLDPSGVRGGLEAFEQDTGDRPPFYLSKTEIKLLAISGVGFFLDAYDLFIINQVTVMLQFVLYDGKALPAGLHGLVNASANIGSVIGQFGFGYLADALGRKAIYGKELMIIIFATILSMAAPTGPLLRAGHPNSVLVWLFVWRIVLGIGVGADYPLSASVSSDRVSVRKRGVILAYVFANQASYVHNIGWGSLIGSLVTMITIAAYKHVINDEGKVSRADGIWRIIVGLSLIPAFATLYFRLTLPESKRYIKARQRVEGIDSEESTMDETLKKDDSSSEKHSNRPATHVMVEKKQHVLEFISYFSEWRHLKILIGTCSCWFFLDIAFYGINLNQSSVLQQIGFGGKGNAWHVMWETALGNLVITALGFVPGYYVTVLTVEYLGRKWIQMQGFLLQGLFLAILAGTFGHISTAGFVVNFALLQFFFNFGANATTFLYPAEVFPTRFRASAHGMSAACGKAGAIIASLGFNALSMHIGTNNVLWIFFGCSMIGAVCTLLLPEVKGRDADEIDAQELREAHARNRVQ